VDRKWINITPVSGDIYPTLMSLQQERLYSRQNVERYCW